MIKILVDSEDTKKMLLDESKYVHDSPLDSNKCNTLMHIYMNPDMIEVVSENKIN